MTDLNRYVRGWVGYFGLARQFEDIADLDGWIRRRIRMCYWKQWRYARTKVKNLVALGVSLDLAVKHAVSRKKYWRMSRTPALHYAMTNKWPRATRLTIIKAGSGTSQILFTQPPSADPQARWCVGCRQQWRRLPDFRRISPEPEKVWRLMAIMHQIRIPCKDTSWLTIKTSTSGRQSNMQNPKVGRQKKLVHEPTSGACYTVHIPFATDVEFV